MNRTAAMAGWLAALVVAGCAAAPASTLDERGAQGALTTTATTAGELDRAGQIGDDDPSPKGAFGCDFRLPGDLPKAELGPILERDRMYMAAQPGFIIKRVPIRFGTTLTNGNPDFLGGGRYLFDTYEHARDYSDFVAHGFYLDGVEFLHRPYFLEPECHAWRVLHNYEVGDPAADHVVVRTERFAAPRSMQERAESLDQTWSALLRDAQARGLTGVALEFSPREGLAQLVYSAPRHVPADPNVPDFGDLAMLEYAPPLGAPISAAGWERTFDRTQWVLTVWYPFVRGDHGRASDWPHSPPFPKPSCSDGVCEPSRGEDHASCAVDCAPHCGDAVCDADESTRTCPSDCRI